MSARFPGKPTTDRMRNLPLHAKEKHILNMIWCRVKSEKRSFRPSPAMLESEKRSFRPSPAMLERTRKNSEPNDLAGEVTEVYIPFLSDRFFWRKTSGTKIIQQDTSRWLNWISNLNSMCFLQWKISWWRFVLQTSLVLGTRLSPGGTRHMWLVPMGSDLTDPAIWNV